MLVRGYSQFLVAYVCIVLCSASPAQDVPTSVTIAYLSLHSGGMDGKLVRVRARVEVGWEGDNFLVDPSGAVVQKGRSPNEPPKLRIFCDPRYERQVCAPAFDASALKGRHGAVGTFTGYFHFVPDKKSRPKGMLDPGPLQFSAISVSDLEVPKDR